MAKKGAEKIYTKANHKLSFTLGVIIGIFFISISAFIATIWLKYNPEPNDLDLADYANQSVIKSSLAGRQGIDLSALHFADTDQILGSATAPYTFVVYLDLTDAHSSRQFQVLREFSVAHPKKVKIVWRHFPLAFHSSAKPAAIAAECAGAQQQFWEFVTALYAWPSTEFDQAVYLEIAKTLNLQTEQFANCLNDPQVAAAVDTQLQQGIATGISGTPNLIYLNSRDNTFKYLGGYTNLDYLESLLP